MADPPHFSTRARLFGGPDVSAPTGSEAAAFDRDAIDRIGVPQSVLMENAGRSAAQIVARLFPEGPVVGLVGSGNNGGDALVVLRTLAAWGRSVTVVPVAGRPPDALHHGWPLSAVAPSEEGPLELAALFAGAGVVVDGILGTGVQGPPRRRQASVIQVLNASGASVVSLDIPSGVDATTGATPGEAVDARVTIAFGWPKLGTLLPPGRGRAGRLLAVEIGFPPADTAVFGAGLITPGWAHAHRPVREPETHKYKAGTMLLVAGGVGMAGAAVMAARAAQRAGLGLLSVASVPENRSVIQSTVPEAIFVDATDLSALLEAEDRAAATAVGPGLGRSEQAGAILDTVLNAPSRTPLVMDADALSLIGQGRLDSLRRVAGDRPTILTPHVGELERISTATREDVEADRVAVARAVASDLGVTLLLKGLPSVVAGADGFVRLDTVGSSDLATGGMGDVLTGVTGSFVAQGAEAGVGAALALYFTGRAACLSDRGPGLVPDDVVDHLPEALAEPGDGWSDLDLPFVRFDQDPPR